ncbi:16986_t:CDS:2 [Acaulospora colombiana]|uniref:16986_t:CDS:1 n=1 Tax=Acaulospora colombiana TaxID=27376 RepID=A0ACA9LSH7_9GLOM|nr:16986_t:CDS:2 [Acaulospora colombiana]
MTTNNPNNLRVTYKVGNYKGKLLGDQSTTTDEFVDFKDKSHFQLFYDITDISDTAKLTPKYFREVFKPDKKYKLYWFKDALKSPPQNNQKSSSTSSPTAIWTIEPLKFKFSKIFRKAKRPKQFAITFTDTGSRSVFKFDGGKNEQLGYSGDTYTPFNSAHVQRYRWVRYSDGSKWVFISRDEPNNPFVEFRKSEIGNEFIIVFIRETPSCWNPNITDQILPPPSPKSSPSIMSSSEFTATSSFRDSATTGITSDYSSYRESTSSGTSSRVGANKHPSILGVVNSVNNFDSVSPTETKFFDSKNDENPNKFWLEFVLASTVVIQDEVNSRKYRMWKS